jgi:hypothetical protein
MTRPPRYDWQQFVLILPQTWPCWMRRGFILTLPVSGPLWAILVCVAAVAYLFFEAYSGARNLWRCDGDGL